jgi:sec-independent protein translocase protein TatA
MAMVGDIMQPTHLLFVLVVALLVLGPKRLPEVGRQLGNGLRDFRAAINGEKTEHRDEVTAPYTEPAAEHGLAENPSETTGEHAFAHQASESVAPAQEETGTAGGDQPASSADGHEFAYEAPKSAEQRTDPPS